MPLHIAAGQGHADVTALLIREGATVNALEWVSAGKRTWKLFHV